MKIITTLKLANSVKCGTDQDDLLMDNKYSMTLEGIVVRIESKKQPQHVTYTTLMNAAWWKEQEPEASKGTTVAQKAAPRKGEVVL